LKLNDFRARGREIRAKIFLISSGNFAQFLSLFLMQNTGNRAQFENSELIFCKLLAEIPI